MRSATGLTAALSCLALLACESAEEKKNKLAAPKNLRDMPPFMEKLKQRVLANLPDPATGLLQGLVHHL